MATLPADRTPQEWVNFYLQVESDVASGKSVSMDGRTFQFEDLDSVRRARKEWERRVLQQRSSSTQTVGGLRYKTPAMN